MKKPKIPACEAQRLRALEDYDVLDTPSEPAFDALTKLAAHIAQVPITLVSLVDAQRQWFKSRYGLDAPETPREVSFCGHVVASERLLVVPDARDDARFTDNPLVTGEPRVCFYAGFPLRTHDGYVLGTLCAIDHVPRTLSTEQHQMLALLARQVIDQLELRRYNRQLTVRDRGQSFLLDALPGLYLHLAADLTLIEARGHAADGFPHTRDALVGQPLSAVLPADACGQIRAAIDRALIERCSQRTVYARMVGTSREYFEAAVSAQRDGSVVIFVSHCTERERNKQTLKAQNELLAAIVRTQSDVLAQSGVKAIFARLLSELLSLTGSEYGFIGEVRHSEDGAPYLKTYAISNIAWDDATRKFYDDNAPQGLEFRNLDTLFGAAIVSGKPVIANDPKRDPRSGGLPKGHPSLDAFFGLPLYSGETMVGVVGVANRPQGYDEALLEFLRPFSATIAQVIVRTRNAVDLDVHRRFFQLGLDLLCTANDRLYFEALNPAWESTLGWSQAELRAKPFTDFVHPDDLDSTVRTAGQLLEGATVVHFVNRYRHKKGHWVPLAWNAVAEDGVFYATATDLSAQREAERATRQLAAVVESSSDAILTLSPDGMISSWNAAAAHMFGYAAEAAIGQPLSTLLPPEHMDAQAAALRRVQGGERVTHFDAVYLTQAGTPVDVSVSLSPLWDEDRKLAGVASIVRDISDRKALERMQSEFISTVSHELRTPLTSIRGSLGLVVGGILGPLSAEVKEYLDIALSNTERLIRLVNDILDIEKIQSGMMEFCMQSLAVADLMRDAMTANEAYAASQGTRLQLCTPLPHGEVLADAGRLQQVLANLISNAAKFSPPEAAVELSVEVRGDVLRITVRDHGPGIPEAFRDRIFQRFAQADASSTRSKGGTGLGLSISQAIVEQLQGRIGFGGAPGGGTAFFFELPYLPAVDQLPQTSDTPRLLVCEDDVGVLRVLIAMFQQAGYSVDAAPTLERAQRLLSLRHYDAVTLDLHLADGDGLQLLPHLRGHETNREVPVFVISGSSQAGLELAALHVADVFVKPFDEQRVLSAVTRAVRRCSSEAPRLLHVEDDPDVTRIVRRSLPQHWHVVHADSVAAAQQAVAALDHIGHGKSDGIYGHMDRFQDYLDTLVIFQDQVAEAFPDVPLVLLRGVPAPEPAFAVERLLEEFGLALVDIGSRQ
ncbi:MAG: PAS domain S-box protein, partial [Polyangiales bacterium]